MNVTSDAPAAPAPSSTVPVRAEGLELLGPLAGSGYQRQPWLVRRADGQTLQMTPLLYAVLEAVDGRRNDAEVARVAGAQVGRHIEAEDVRYLIDEKLRPLGVLQAEDGSQPAVARSNPLLALRFRFVVSNPEVTRKVTGPFAILFRPYVVLPMLVAFALISGWLLLDKGLASATHQALYQPGVLLLIFGLTILSAGFHEFGHAAACRYGGATPGAMGVGLYLVWPAFYTEVSDCYRLGRWGRIRVDIGGLYFNAIFAVAMLGAWAVTGWDALLLIIPAQLLQMLRQLLPFVRFDGYHILADLTGVPDLFSHIKPTLQGLLPGRRRRTVPHPLKRWARVVVTTWVLAVVPVLLAALLLMVKVLPRIAATAWDSLGLQYEVLQTNWADGAYADVGVRLLSMFTIALPLASISYLLARITRRSGRRVWRATDGRPPLRALVVLGAAGVAALVAWMWWPQEQYEPIRPDEGGTLIDVLRPVAQHESSPVRMLAQAQLGAPQPITAAAPVQLAQPAPTFQQIPGTGVQAPVNPATGETAEPRVGIVLTPRPGRAGDGSAAVYGESSPEPIVMLAPEGELGLANLPEVVPPENAANQPSAQRVVTPGSGERDTQPPPESRGWVFPFDEPRAARGHDNQARAVNTVDGSVLYDVSFAMVWVTDGSSAPVDHRNDAYALASCTRCGTVAIAFQVILAVGHTDVVVPQNVSVAVNYECVECTTYALAVQLIATLTQEPSDEAMAELDAIWAHAQQVEAQIQDMSLTQIHAEIAAIEATILQVLHSDGGGSATQLVDEAAADDAVEALSTEEPTETASATANPPASVTSAPTPAGSATPTPASTATTPPSSSESPESSPSPGSTEASGEQVDSSSSASPENEESEASSGATSPAESPDPDPSPSASDQPSEAPSGDAAGT